MNEFEEQIFEIIVFFPFYSSFQQVQTVSIQLKHYEIYAMASYENI